MVWATRPDGWNTYHNHRWVEYTGLTLEESYGHGWITAFHPDDKQRARDAWQRATEQNESYSLECRLRRADGIYRWWLIRGVPLSNKYGEIQKWYGTCTDIQELKEADIAIRESEARLHFALEMCNTGAWEVDLETYSAYRSIEHARIFGYADLESEWSHDKFLEHVVEEDRPEIAALIKEGFDTGNEIRVECRIRRTDGKVRWIMAAGRFRVPKLEGAKLVAVGIIQDITERKNAQIALELLNDELEERVKMRTDELSALNQSLESFVYSVSHDLKTPLRGIDGYSRLLQQDYGAILDGEGNLFLSNIREGINRMNDLIDDLLAYSSMTRRKLDAEQINVNLLLENIVMEQKEDISKRGVVIEINLPPLTICADEEGLALVLRNLVQNALKFSQHNPAPHIEVGATQDENTVILWIKDNGIGFEMKYVDRIFEIFQRLHRLEDYPGTGIGLALVKTAIQRMNGKVWAESVPGHGATFFLGLKK
jgi:PAS domain S-box-containing protein